MKTYEVTVLVQMLGVYRIKAESEDEADENWIYGELIETDDNLPNEILTIRVEK